MTSERESECGMFWRTSRRLRLAAAKGECVEDHLFDIDCYAEMTDSAILKQRCHELVAEFRQPTNTNAETRA